MNEFINAYINGDISLETFNALMVGLRGVHFDTKIGEMVAPIMVDCYVRSASEI